jgi:ribose transport system substrate-binding protein
MKWKILILLLISLAIAGCGPQLQTGKPRIALVMKSLANEFFKTMQEGATAHQKAHAGEYELIAGGIKDEIDVTRQVELVEQMIAQQINAIVIAPADSKAVVAACQWAQAAGIVVVNIDNKLDSAVLAERGIKIPFIGPDNRKGAQLAGDFLAKQLKHGDQLAVFGIEYALEILKTKTAPADRETAVDLITAETVK